MSSSELAMIGRGQTDFARFPSFAARLYSSLTRTRAIQEQHREIASYLASKIDRGRVLDIGPGPGCLLFELHRCSPAFDLFGLDISQSMVELARSQLSGTGVEILQGDIRQTRFESSFFDLVSCTGSFYLWDQPRECLEEVFRILKPHRSAYLFETYSDCERSEVIAALKANLKDENLVRRMIAPRLFLNQLKMTYKTSEIDAIIQQTSFANSFATERIRLTGVPAWLRITLERAA